MLIKKGVVQNLWKEEFEILETLRVKRIAVNVGSGAEVTVIWKMHFFFFIVINLVVDKVPNQLSKSLLQ